MRHKPIRVMIVDDHLLLREGVQLLLSTYAALKVVALASDGEQAIALCRTAKPHVILMDLVMPRMDGPTAIARIRTAFPVVQILALTSFVDDILIMRALEAGAIGYVLKTISAAELVAAIQAAHQGRATIDAAAAQVVVQRATRPDAPGHNLTRRERDVLRLLVAGKTNTAIAQHLALGQGTVRIYVSHILTKLGARNRTEAAALARQYHLVPDGA